MSRCVLFASITLIMSLGPLPCWALQQTSPQPGTAGTPQQPATETAQAPAQPQPAPPATPEQPQPPTPETMRALLYHIYVAGFRILDLLSQEQPQNWKASEDARSTFQREINDFRNQFKALDQWRTQFYEHPENANAGRETLAALEALLPSLESIVKRITEYEGEQAGALYGQPAKQLFDYKQTLASYLAPPVTPAASSVAGPTATPAGAPKPAVPETEQVSTPNQPPPVATLEEPQALKPEVVKALLHRIYVAGFRINDLLSQEQPQSWKVSEAERDTLQQEIGGLRNQFKTLDQWRTQFDQQPESAYLGYETLAALGGLLPTLDKVSQHVAQYEGAQAGALYESPAKQFVEYRQTLASYIGPILQKQDEVARTSQANLAACENSLGYAMHNQVGPAVPMKNIVPEFKGHRRTKHVDMKEGKHHQAKPPNHSGQEKTASPAKSST